MKSSVTTKNMVSIPAEIARRYAISPGCKLDWVPIPGSDDELRVRITPKRGVLARGLIGAGRAWSPETDTVDALVAEREAEG